MPAADHETADPSTSTRAKKPSSKQRMLLAAVELMSEQSAAAITIDEVVARSGAPRGSVYYHFPEGRSQLITEALDLAGVMMNTAIAQGFTGDPAAGIAHIVDYWIRILTHKDFAASCPITSAAIGGSTVDPELVPQAHAIFHTWQELICAELERAGIAKSRTPALATMVVSSIQGAVVLSRAQRDTAPLKQVRKELEQLLQQAQT
ncbi:TetR/AcrR family transcriptional regulator [Nocardia mexicana]|uniref:TetR family transcriptional regulator n=1 Tax=Nocardia mexicana TaxID=279262 RepID=A0A370GLP6_9NOCA|nr:TetR/AcrR family transcriptional regulator [Nocardia mexicana]RDI43314.1 TetR family transcriptional regulator [Nocardia mexicana]